MIPGKHGTGLLALARIVACGLLLAVTGAAGAAAEAVGTVSFVIGVTRLIDGDKRANPVARGMPVHAGDSIETEAGGHVHLRFVDGAFVSVRPGSRLVIESYRYDAARPQDSAIRFKLEQGVVRSISGKGTEAAREHFRLNTPIAAIGVRGTDFVVQAEAERVRVAINRGAIVLTPLGEGCRADALGACATAATRMLSVEMGNVMLEFQRREAVPKLVPINGTPSLDRVAPPAPEESGAAGRSGRLRNEQNNEVLAAQAIATAQGQVAIPPAPLPPSTLMWGRWGFYAQFPGDTLSVPLAEARVGREPTLGNEYYGLWRPESTLPSLISNLGQVNFTLRDAQVHLVRGNVAELGRVDGAWLSVNFAARQFATTVNMSHPQVGAATLQASGGVQDNGVFVAVTPGNRVAGALTLDGKEAGYFFEQAVIGGAFTGITRWSR